MRPLIVPALLVGLLAGMGTASVSAGAEPVSPSSAPPPPTSPSSSAPPAPATPGQLVDQSVRDMEHGSFGAAVHDDVTALRRGPLLIHGNYCGIGNRPGTQPIDALDAACMRHDACTKTGQMPSCACDGRLRAEASAIAVDPRTPPKLQVLASATASAMAVLVCH